MALAPELRNRLSLPAFAAPMFLCSGVDLAVASCKAGIIGSLTRNHCRDLEELETQLRSVRGALAEFSDGWPDRKIGPLAVNISPSFSSEEFQAHLKMCARYGAQIIVTSVGDPTKNAPMVRDAGLLHFHDATTIRFAEKAVAANVDGIVCIGAGGGGRAGTVSHLAFVPIVRSMFDGTIVLAGAVSTGAVIRAAEILGADLAYVGTRFIATREAMAPDAYKRMLVDGDVTDVIYTSTVKGMPASWLKASLRRMGLDPENLPSPPDVSELPEGKTPWRDLWSGGQGIGLIKDIPTVAELVRRLREEYVAACAIPGMAEAARAGGELGSEP